ncbi:uncharacterized protein LOC105918643 isoform X1 [Fundulus heteroclitus]|uniref:uncharacterized protein LOC105918643 isoform X1 n=1 Tax=Fundulus heteroclitus TaxID=8078 RepID=UPI00165CAEDB|nr:uncharacterized protein LOC105918643 isoform X1 [Fundulus heteroclitus]
MKVCHTLICFFFLTLQDGDTGEPRRGEEGTNITVQCSFSYFGVRRFFCRETCEGENILIDTTEDSFQRGRYSIQYEDKGYLSADLIYVSITGLKKSDSGRYRCQCDTTWGGTLYEDFDLIVTEASTSSEPDWTPATYPSTFLSSASLTTTTLTQRLSSSSSSSSSTTSQQTRTSTGPKALQDGDTGEPYRREEGTNITVACSFGYSGSRRFFCRETCEGENILIETTENSFQRGRYSILYEKKGFLSYDIMNVSITGLKKSDSGRYRCQCDETWFGTLYDDFDLIVTEASTFWNPSTSPSTFLSSASLTTTTLTQRLSSSSSSSSSTTSQQTKTSTGPKDLLLYVVLIIAVLIFMSAAALLIFFRRKRFGRQKTPPMEIDQADTPKESVIYEEIREEDRDNKPSPGEISTVYATCCNPDGAESTTIYSLADCPQNTAEDDGAEYSEVQLLNNTTSSNGAPSGRADNVTYSEPRIATSSGNHNDSPPLYSTVAL